jgi:pilus assembly protein CpaD
MFPRSITLTLLAPALLIGGCSGTKNRSLESVHQPVVSRTDYVFDAATAGYGLADGEPRRIAGWLSSLRVGYGDRIYVDDPAGGSARDQVAAEAARYGLLISDPAPVTPGEITPGTVRVIVTRMKASVPGCPDYSHMQPDFEASTSSNFGCASNSNLAAMVARPEDLVRGQPGAETSDPVSGTKAIDVYRKAPPTGAGGLKAATPGGGS